MSFDYVVDHAQKHVWCVPNQDLQSILQPQKLTPLGGAQNLIKVMWRTINLPTATDTYHVYQMSSLDPRILGLLPSRTWESFSACMNVQRLIVDIYANTGVQMPRYGCFYQITRDGALIVAVMVQKNVAIDLDTDTIFFRFYSNAYYQSQASTPNVDYISTAGQTVLSTAAIMALQDQFNAIQAQITAGTLKGQIYAFVNGWQVSGIDLFSAALGDCVEWVYDASIYMVVELPIADLQSFTSTLDTELKYLVHYAQANDGEINYFDDIDFFLHLPGDSNGRWKGLYYHRNAGLDAVRQVTHKDYAIPTAYVQAYATQQPTWGLAANLVLRMHIRKGGFNRPLVFENNRIAELYKLPNAEVLQAMIGVNATVPNWTAAALEDSAYPAVMGALLTSDITNLLVQEAYGYNSISQIIGMTPEITRLYSGQQIADVPYSLSSGCSAFEYDANGFLIGFFLHTVGTTYACSTLDCALVELLSGAGSMSLDETYNQKTQNINEKQNYRYYVCPISTETGLPTYQWSDVTGSSQYMAVGGVVTWLIDQTKFYTLVRGDSRFLAYEIDIAPQSGVLEFTLEQQTNRSGTSSNIVMEIPLGELQLWSNHKALVENVDYIVQFPKVVITNKKFLVQPATQPQLITVRFMGFCKSDLTREVPGDVGWIKYGRLSDNNVYDIREDRVLSMIVGGATYDRSELRFQEDDGTVFPADATNGEPYQIRDIVVPLDGLVNAGTYSLRAASQVIDAAVSAYLSSRLDEVDPSGPSAIPNYWPVYSPFFCAIMNDLISGVFVPAFLEGQYSDQQVVDACAPYTYLLAYDQTQTAIAYNPTYMVVQPHNLDSVVTVSIYVYKFLRKVNSLFLHNVLNFAPFMNIATIA